MRVCRHMSLPRLKCNISTHTFNTKLHYAIANCFLYIHIRIHLPYPDTKVF